MFYVLAKNGVRYGAFPTRTEAARFAASFAIDGTVEAI
jgi:hypothetical protein